MLHATLTTTIAAPATPTGGALCVIRISGSNALTATQALFNRPLIDRTAIYGTLSNELGAPVDAVVCTYFAAPRSYTGEHSVEIACHGSAWVVGEILRLLAQQGVEPAGAGEFSRRAFLNGKLDLSQAEAVADLIASSSAAAAAVALRQMKGGYKLELADLRARLLHLKAMLELELDFSEEDVEFAPRAELTSLLAEARAKVSHLLSSFRNGNALKNGVSVALIGAPNVGKSTLLNALVGDDRSIVADQAGTTRDYIEAHATIGGVLFRFIDTAGLRSGAGVVEAEGIRRSREQAQGADLVLILSDNASVPLEAAEFPSGEILHTKADTYVDRSSGGLYVSARSGAGLDELREWLLARSGAGDLASDRVLVSNARHASCLSSALSSLALATDDLGSGGTSDRVCSSLGDALYFLAEITGEVTTDEVLSHIFSKFCIGK